MMLRFIEGTAYTSGQKLDNVEGSPIDLASGNLQLVQPKHLKKIVHILAPLATATETTTSQLDSQK